MACADHPEDMQGMDALSDAWSWQLPLVWSETPFSEDNIPPAGWWNHQLWRALKGVKMWHLGTWLISEHGRAGGMVGLGDLRGLFQPL